MVVEMERVAETKQTSLLPSRSGATGRSSLEAGFSILILLLLLLTVSARKIASEGSGHLMLRTPGGDSTAAPSHSPAARNVTPVVGKLVGAARRVIVRPGETLLKIARRENTDAPTLARLNGLKNERVRPGQKLELPALHILPSQPPEGIVLNIPERGVYLFHNGRFVARYPVAVGARTWETPVGDFRIVRKVINPTWLPPKIMVQREGIPAMSVPPGGHNPLGDRWMGWSAPEVGFHSTPAVESVGRMISHACVRMYPEAAHTLFRNTYLGMPIYSIYEPILVGKQGDDYYLSVAPDIYARKPITRDQVWKRLAQAGIWNLVDPKKVGRVMVRQDGYPYLIAHAGAD